MEVGMDVIAERSDIDAAVSGKTICTIFADAEKEWGDRPALRWKRNGDWQLLTWKGYREQVPPGRLALRELDFGAGPFGLSCPPPSPAPVTPTPATPRAARPP